MKRINSLTLSVWLCYINIAQPAELTAISEPTVVDRGPHHRTWARLHQYRTATGNTVSELQTAYHELKTGLHYFRDSQWHTSKEDLELFEGGAVARNGQHQLIISPSVADVPAIDLSGPQGTRLRSTIFGLAYLDPLTGRSVLFAEIKDSIGELVANNSVLWPDSFTDINADVRCTYRLSGIETDVILREQLPPPEDWQLDPATSRVQIWTEFFDPPPPLTQRSVIRSEDDPVLSAVMQHPDFVDDLIAFPDMHLSRGKAFAIETEAVRNAAIDVDSFAPVGKQWAVVLGRTFLIETVEYASLKPLLDTLPVVAAANQAGNNKALAAKKKVVSSTSEMLAGLSKPAAHKTDKKLQLAQGPSRPQPGVIVDYFTVNGSLTNYTFEAMDTYYISGATYLYGTSNVAEGGTCIKFAPTNSAKIDLKGKLLFDTDLYRPAVLTARDDHSQGGRVGSATLSGVYPEVALRFDYNSSNVLAAVTNIKVMYARRGLEFAGGHGHEIRHAQFINCGTAVHVDSASAAIRNALGWNLTNALVGASSSTSTSLWEHATFDQVTNLVTTATGFFTNCLIVGVVTTNGLAGAGNSVVASSNGVFATVGGGSHYLADDTYRNIGVTNTEPQLSRESKNVRPTPHWSLIPLR